MTTVYKFSGDYNMHTEMIIRSMAALGIAALAVVGAPYSYASELPVSTDAEAAHQVEADQERRNWRLDPAIFTDISLVNAPEVAIKLPEDQREEP